MADRDQVEDDQIQQAGSSKTLTIDSERLREMVIDLELSKERTKELRLLSDSLLDGVKALTSSNKTEEIFANLIESLSSVIEFDAAMVLNKIDPKYEDPYLTVSFSTTDLTSIGDRWTFGKTFQRAMKGKPLVLADVSKVQEWQEQSNALRALAQSTLYLPVMGNRNTAILVFINENRNYYTNKHRALAAKLIPLLQQAIINSEYTEQIQESLAIVRGKNKQIETILNNINEGVFVIQPDRTIADECSPAYHDLLLQAQCEPQTYHDVVKSLMGIVSVDQLDVVLTSIDASIGEDELQWSMNAHHLPTESQFQTVEGKNFLLEWDWSPIEDESGAINEVLVSIRDVTLLRQLQSESEKEKELIEIIYNIVEAGTTKTERFIATSRMFITENRNKIGSDKPIDQATVALLFRNMHTIKGNARTLKFKSISSISHTIEDEYAQMRNGRSDVNRNRMLADLDQLEREIEHYATVLRDNLGGIGQSDVNQKAVKLAETLMALLQDDAQDTLDKVKDAVFQHHAIGLSDMLEQHIIGLSDLAPPLGKSIPHVEINDLGLRFKSDFATVLSESLTHCFRNSIDHGIETTDTRISAGKPPQGTINITVVKQDDGRYKLLFGDDGIGLNLQGLAEKMSTSNPTDEDIADFIFTSGISTSDSVTDLSGRGVGMDAVKSFMKKYDAETSIQFCGDRSDTGYRHFQIAITLPASHVMVVDHR